MKADEVMQPKAMQRAVYFDRGEGAMFALIGDDVVVQAYFRSLSSVWGGYRSTLLVSTSVSVARLLEDRRSVGFVLYYTILFKCTYNRRYR